MKSGDTLKAIVGQIGVHQCAMGRRLARTPVRVYESPRLLPNDLNEGFEKGGMDNDV